MVLRQCATCGRQFTKTEHFKRHERSHTRERPYSCTVCDKAFSRSDVLFRHMKSHNQRGEASTNGSSSKRKSTISENASQLSQDSYQIQHNDSASTSQNGIPLGQILSPSSYIGPPEQTLDSRSHHGSLEVPGPYMATPTNHPLNTVDMQMINDWRIQSQVTNPQPTSFPMHIPRHASHLQPDTSAFDGRLSHPQHLVHNLRPEVGSGQFQNPELQWLPHHGTLDQSGYNYPYQMWLFPTLEDLEQSPDFLAAYASISDETMTVSDGKAPSAGRHLDSADGDKSIKKVPRERFARVQRYWASRPHKQHRLMPLLWTHIISTPTNSLFFEETNSHSDAKGTSSWGLDAECTLRLRSAFRVPISFPLQSPLENPTLDPLITSSNHDNSDFPPPEILDIALGQYFRKIHPMIPFMHIPTFSVKTTPTSLLFAMCLAGLSVLDTTGATRFVYKIFPVFLHRVCSDVVMCTVEKNNPGRQLNAFAAALLALGVSATMGDNDCFAQTRMLYASLLTMAQQHGLFTIDEGPPLSTLLADVTDPEQYWISWSKIESAKRLILGLILGDSWFSNLTGRSPIIRSEAVCIAAPCDETLFQARNAAEWQSIVQSGKQQIAPEIRLSYVYTLTQCDTSFGYMGKCCCLALLQIQVLESYHRLIRNNQQENSLCIPWQVYTEDPSAKHLVNAMVVTCQSLGPASQDADTNCTVLWHSLCIMLLADFHVFELAAGRHGPGPALAGLNDIVRWSQTVAARRACVHAAQIFKLMSDRKVSDNLNIHSVTALFASALILGLYLFMVPSTSTEDDTNGGDALVEIVDVEIDWLSINDLGFTEDSMQNKPRKSIDIKLGYATNDPEQSKPRLSQPTISTVHQFIKFGGPVTIFGTAQNKGYESSRRVFLDFANVMETLSGRRLRNFSQVLHIMADDLMNVDKA